MNFNKRIIIILFISLFISWLAAEDALALSTVHHTINIFKDLGMMAVSPLKGVLVTGPSNVKKAYIYEVYEREDVEDRGLLKYKLFGIWRAPGEELKGIVSGVVEGVDYGGQAIKEFASIFWSD
ncbi:MAG: hypothetical protein KAV18_04860 [Candidatus Omnitrophica bacterium]|nr:hypothetical protein [Candidatus Omnitrophota bacterium]MCK4423383.1 hypothetical protein [Candidatus Omnitrophota bacterium]